MKISKKAYCFVASFKTVRIILFCLLTLSATSAFSQWGPLDEDHTITDAEYDIPYGLAGVPVKSWIVAKHAGSWWTIWAIDVVSGDILTGISAGNLEVVLEGTTVGAFKVLSKWGYGNNLGSEATVSVSCQISISFPGFPPVNGNYVRSHVYVLQ